MNSFIATVLVNWPSMQIEIFAPKLAFPQGLKMSAVYEWTENGQDKSSGIYVRTTKAVQCGEQLLWEYINYEFQRNPKRKK
jgi:hypothetical protein